MQFPDHELSVVVFSNDSSFRAGRLARKVADIYLADEIDEAAPPRDRSERSRPKRPEPVTLSPDELAVFAGDYYSRELNYVYPVAVQGGELQVEVRGRTHSLTPLGEGTFRWGRRRLEFEFDDSGTASGFALSDGDVRGLGFRRVTNPLPAD